VRAIAAESWDAVINAAAYTDVDRAEKEEAAAYAMNAEGPSVLAQETGRRGIPLIHISTDYVYDGRKGSQYVERDAVAPLNAYGRSKLAGERAVCAANPRHVVLRTSWLYSPYRKNFVKTILRLAAERNNLRIVDDQRGSPTAASDLAQACLGIAMRCASDADHSPYGIYHYAGAGDASWFEFAKSIIAMAKLPTSIVAITTKDYPTPAIRPADTRLDCTSVVRDFNLVLRPWRDALAVTIDRLFSKKDAL
jgi:dTDP-4-dehydrorhamnose reductase